MEELVYTFIRSLVEFLAVSLSQLIEFTVLHTCTLPYVFQVVQVLVRITTGPLQPLRIFNLHFISLNYLRESVVGAVYQCVSFLVFPLHIIADCCIINFPALDSHMKSWTGSLLVFSRYLFFMLFLYYSIMKSSGPRPLAKLSPTRRG